MHEFKLTEEFVKEFEGQQPEWGSLGLVVYKSKYARRIEETGCLEEYWQTVRRVVEGTFSVQKAYCKLHRLPWNDPKSHRSAQEMYRLMWEFKFLPPGRGLWAMGSPAMKRTGACLQNCGYITTQNLTTDFSDPFCFLMDMSMLGAGVGSDTRGAGTVKIVQPGITSELYVVDDSREGWVDLVRIILDAYVGKGKIPTNIDYSKIRAKGMPLKTMGGIAPGPDPLQLLAEQDIHDVLRPIIGQRIESTQIVDLFNVIAKCVVSGNLRRSASILLGDPTDTEFLELKNPVLYQKELEHHRWTSNNSVFAEVGMDYSLISKQTTQNGEPGLVWLENAKNYGRMGKEPNYKDLKVSGCNACGEQFLEGGGELCVSGDTRIQIKNGTPLIKDVVGKEVEVWNGVSWAKVVPFKVGRAKLYRVYLSDGSYLDTTTKHGWHIKPNGKRIYRRIETEKLEIGSKSISFSLGEIEGNFEPNAYEYGLFSGDGYIDRKKPMLCVCGQKSKLKNLDVKGVWYKEQIIKGYAEPLNRLSFKGILDLEKAKELNNKTKGLPSWIFEMDKGSISNFVAGLIETDGSLMVQVNTDNYTVYGNEEKIRDLQLLLRRIGVNHSTIHKNASKGDETNFGIRNYDLYCCYIPSYECGEIPTRIKIATRIGCKYRRNNAYKISKTIDSSRKQKIVKIEELGENSTYCFREPKRGMGVFGNVLTYQCTLVETFPSRHSSYEEYERTLKYAYLYGKTVTLVPTHDERTNAIMNRNRRIGTSQSGIQQARQKLGTRVYLDWCDKGYDYLRKVDKIYSDWLGIPESKKITSVKPSGTTSLLPGVTPGIHYAHSEYYIRNMRFDTEDDLVNILRQAGYVVAPDTYSKTSVVVSFPVHEEFFSRSKNDVSMWEQLEGAAQLQSFWADNAVSITVTFKPEEAKDIPRALELYETRLKSVSFLPLADHKYVQAPYITITKDQYEEMVKDIKTLDLSSYRNESLNAAKEYCDGDKCTIDHVVHSEA